MGPNTSKTNTPGDEIERRLTERGWTHDDLAYAIGKHRPLVTSLVSGKRGITPELAVLISAVLGDSPDYWMQIEGVRQLSLIPHDSGSTASEMAKLIDLVPVKEMERRGWIKPTRDTKELESEIKRFFEVESLEAEPSIFVAARKSNPESPLDRQQRAWVGRARQLASAHPANKYDPTRIPELVGQLRRLAAYPRECSDVCEVLRQYGIRFVVVEPLERCRIDGAAFWVSDSPTIAMSLRHGRIDAFWFTLMHELAHIMHNDVASVDSDLAGKGQIPSRMKPDSERKADEAAANMLIPREELESFVRMFSPLYSKTRIIQFAHRVKIHPGIIVGQLQHRAEIGWDAGRTMLVDVRDFVTSSALTDGWGKEISPGTFE